MKRKYIITAENAEEIKEYRKGIKDLIEDYMPCNCSEKAKVQKR